MSDLPIESAPKAPPVLRGWLIYIFGSLLGALGIQIFIFLDGVIGGIEGSDSLYTLWQNGDSAAMPKLMLVAAFFDALSPLVMVGYFVFLLRLFFQRSRLFPFAYFGGAAVNLSISILDRLAFYVAGLPLGTPIVQGGSVVGAIVVYQYLITQSRPMETFVH